MCSKSSFHGKICEIPGISLDNFTGANLDSRAFFLSHYHADHIQGLNSVKLKRHLKRTNTYIYTSRITAAIMEFELNDLELMKYVKPLGRESTVITLPNMPDDGLEELFVEVTLIPAGHSFGSTMFLFKTTESTVLYTGDFRIRINDISKYAKLHRKDGDPIPIDVMYIDTTFIDGIYEEFAKRTDTANAVIDEIDKWLQTDSKYAVSIFMYANYTFEFLLNKIYERLKRKVYVNESKWKLYSTIQDLVPGITNDVNESRIHLCRHKYERDDHSACVDGEYEKYLHIHLTAMKWRQYTIDCAPIARESDTCFDACFSTHCSRSEIVSFVEHFSPGRVEGFPNPYVSPGTPVHSEEEYILTPKLSASKKRRLEMVSKESLSGVVKKFSIFLRKHSSVFLLK